MKLEDLIRLKELEKSRKELDKSLHASKVNYELTNLWNTNSEIEWDLALKRYWSLIKPENIRLEERMGRLDPNEIEYLSDDEFYNFLHDEYFVWKYTAKNRLATTRKQLIIYKTENRLQELDKVKKEIFSFDLNNIEQGLRITSQIKGLGIAGASGLLSLLYPKYFGTVDQFVLINLRRIYGLNQRYSLLSIKPESLRLKDGVELINIMKERANELNTSNNTEKWTPRDIDKILWAYRE